MAHNIAQPIAQPGANLYHFRAELITQLDNNQCLFSPQWSPFT
jgi:hypothetical protein